MVTAQLATGYLKPIQMERPRQNYPLTS